MIESSLTVHDDILQKELSANADDKMKNIVTTIQREQNQIIRNEEAPVLIIQGVAGSGKTSIALHRIAYLLYTLKGNISSRDILIISPNKVFADYISNVLPELGEETVPETSMEQILSELLENKYKYRNFFDPGNRIAGKTIPGFYRTNTIQGIVRFHFPVGQIHPPHGKQLFQGYRCPAHQTYHHPRRLHRGTVQTIQPLSDATTV